MTTTSGIGTPSTSTSTTSAAAASKSLAQNFDAFLTLLTKQLQNQDPLKPMDSNEFTQQLVQYSSVEQSIKTNDNLEKLLAMGQSEQTLSYVGMIGKDVTYIGDQATLGETGTANWKIEVASGTVQSTVQVVDATGKTVFQKTGTPTSGVTDFKWDGNKTNGTRADAGTYTLKVTGLDAKGQSSDATVYASGIVTGIETDSEGTSLIIGSFVVAPAYVRAVKNPAT